MTTYKATASHYSNAPEENEVLCSFSSLDQLIHMIEGQTDIFAAMALVKEINEMNGCEIVGRYEIVKIKKHFLKNELLNDKANSDFVKNNLLNSKGSQNPFSENQSSIPIKQIPIDDIANNENKNIKSDSSKNKMRELQKGYMQLLSN